MMVVALALAIFAVPAKANTILSQGTAEGFSWAIDDEGIVYVYPTDIADETGELTYVLYSYGSLQIVYLSTACSTTSISNASSMFESGSTAAHASGSLYEGIYGNVARANVGTTDEQQTTAVEDVVSVHAPGWAYENGAYVYYEPDGTMRTNAWIGVDGEWYYLGEDGTPIANAWVNDNGAYYYVGEDGSPTTDSWLNYNGSYYYLDSNGHPVTNYEYEYGDTLVSFDAQGVCSTSAIVRSNGLLAAVTSACYSTPSTGSGGCAAWVSNVFTNAGVGTWHGNACDFYWSYCTSTDLSELQPGMIIAVSSCAGTAASRAYGHVGIYLGNGVVMQNLLGTVGTMSLSTWLDYFDGYSTPAWGWLGGVVLS